MRAVTLAEFQKWFKKHQNHTWSFKAKHPQFGVKYFQLQFDTRTGDIFRVAAYTGGEGEVAVHIGDDRRLKGVVADTVSILEELECRLGWKSNSNEAKKK